MDNAYLSSTKKVLDDLNTGIKGLSEKESKKRLDKYGLNEIKEKEKTGPLELFVNQFKQYLIVILIFAIIISLFLGETSDAILISVIVLGNALLGFFQEYKAEKSIESLKKYLKFKTTVIRDGKKIRIDPEYVVPGDILILESGDKIPADARIIEQENLYTDESMLTGESTSVKKDSNLIKNKKGISDQKNMLFMGTSICKGTVKAVVVRTGMDTEIGKIAEMIDQHEETYFQKKLDKLGKLLGKIVVFIALIIFLIGLYNQEPLTEMFLISISLAVAAIPEGLPAVVTITLSMGVKKMAKLKAIVKRLPSAETLGSCSVICSDKTGTITENKMTVRKIYHMKNEFDIGDKIDDIAKSILETGYICNTSTEESGDPTEKALLVSAKEYDIHPNCKKTKIIPFDSERKRMSVICKDKMYSKGAVESILDVCDRIKIGNKVQKMTDKHKKQIIEKHNEYAENALRVLAFAYKEKGSKEERLIFLGLQAMIDPPREEAKDAIRKCESAGIKVIMITGDHALTAKAIAKEVGIFKQGHKVVTGSELEDMSLSDLEKIVNKVTVYARVNPEHKQKIIQALRKKGHIIAMTGDGVNDAPALKKADIGIAMNTGTDVSKDSSDIILLDDNFSTIVSAVQEGRHIFENIKNFVRYLLSTNFGEVFTILLASLIGLPLPLVAVQILWINLLTDGLPALSLSLEPVQRDIMKKKPAKKSNIINESMLKNIFSIGLWMSLGTLMLYYISPEEKSKTIAFTTLVLFQLFNVFNCKSFEKSIFSLKTNIYLIGAVLISLFLQLAVLYIPILSEMFYTVPLNITDWIMILVVTSSIVFFEETRKRLIR